MDAILALGLAGAATANAAAPGPGILIASSRAATDGLWSGLRVTLGIAASTVILLAGSWAMILGVLSLTSEAQAALRFGGLALLVMLALTMLTAHSGAGAAAGAPTIGRLRLGDGTLGLTLGLSSPLQLLFLFALLPQFVDVEKLDATAMAIATAAVLVGTAVPFIAASMFSARVLRIGPQMAHRITRLCGVALLAFAGLALVAGQ